MWIRKHRSKEEGSVLIDGPAGEPKQQDSKPCKANLPKKKKTQKKRLVEGDAIKLLTEGESNKEQSTLKNGHQNLHQNRA